MLAAKKAAAAALVAAGVALWAPRVSLGALRYSVLLGLQTRGVGQEAIEARNGSHALRGALAARLGLPPALLRVDAFGAAAPDGRVVRLPPLSTPALARSP